MEVIGPTQPVHLIGDDSDGERDADGFEVLFAATDLGGFAGAELEEVAGAFSLADEVDRYFGLPRAVTLPTAATSLVGASWELRYLRLLEVQVGIGLAEDLVDLVDDILWRSVIAAEVHGDADLQVVTCGRFAQLTDVVGQILKLRRGELGRGRE